MLIKRLLKNKKGTAEVIGSVMFIVILLFFFTNVYLWHDAAVKEMNDLYVQKINSPIAITVSNPIDNQYDLNITNNGGVDATLSWLWVNEKVTAIWSRYSCIQTQPLLSNVVVEAGGSKLRTSILPSRKSRTINCCSKLSRTTGNSASFITQIKYSSF